MTYPRARAGLTIVEMLVSVSIIALLMAILLPAIGGARDRAKVQVSQTQLRQFGQAHAAYGAAWNDRQFTQVNDNLSGYGASVIEAASNFLLDTGNPHPPIAYGWGPNSSGQIQLCGRRMDEDLNTPLLLPIDFLLSTPFGERFGWFRIPNAMGFNDYLSGRHYDPIFYAPKDVISLTAAESCLSTPYEMLCQPPCWHVNIGAWSSYCLSPAALFNPHVMRNEGDGGWQDPFAFNSALKTPSFSQVRYSDIKTHMLEHHWLQNRRIDCNPAATWPSWSPPRCEPFYFNHGYESVPMTLFYDGHVEGLGVQEAMSADSRLQTQAGYGTWNRSTPWGDDGYFIGAGYDALSATSFHVLTNDGVFGRDTLGR